MKKILVTGAAGFIGFHLCKRFMNEGINVVGYDNVNDYYDVGLKESRLDILNSLKNLKEEQSIQTNTSKNIGEFTFIKAELEDKKKIEELFKTNNFDAVVNLAAQAGVRYSIENPNAYIQSNVVGFLNVLEACRHNDVKHLVYASSSSVYGANKTIPFSIHDNIDHPMSMYAATKKANELMAHTYSSLYNLPTTGLRFFTVYGPYGRPDMALFLFVDAILNDRPIKVFNHGMMKRDFTYVDDIVEGIYRLIMAGPAKKNKNWTGENPDPGTSYAPYKVYNIGNNKPVELEKFISVIEDKIGRKAEKNYLPMQAGDVPETYADVTDLMNDVGFKPDTPIEEGIDNFIKWYKKYYNCDL